jgi:hypothetical protein
LPRCLAWFENALRGLEHRKAVLEAQPVARGVEAEPACIRNLGGVGMQLGPLGCFDEEMVV